jgi:adenylate kinase
MNLVFLGAPGAGKGTQAERLTAEKKLAYISTGQILREAIGAASPLGNQAKSYMDAGKLVPDDLVIALVEEFLTKNVANGGFLLDGFPRNLEQAGALDASLKKLGKSLDKVVYFDVNEEIVVRRLSGRRTCKGCGKNWHVEFSPPPANMKCDLCGGQIVQRKDDQAETIRNRLVVYREQTAALAGYYEEKELLVRVDASAEVEEVFRRLLKALAC